jgi:hypothetical protein
METKRGFLSRQRGDAVLNFFGRMLAHGIRLFFCGLHRAVKQFY